VDRPSKKDSAVRQPTSQREPGTLDHGELDDRLPDLDPVTAVYFAAQPVLRTLTTVPALVSLDDEAMKALAFENLTRLPEDMRRLRRYLMIGRTWELLGEATPEPVSLAGQKGLNYCDLTYQLGRKFYHDALWPSSLEGISEVQDRNVDAVIRAEATGDLPPINVDDLRDSWDSARAQLAQWQDADIDSLSMCVEKECQRAKRTLQPQSEAGGAPKDRQDGPVDRNRLAYRGETYPLSSRSWDILNCLWGNGFVPFADLGKHIWDDDSTKDSTIRSAISRLGEQLSGHNLPLEIETRTEKARIRER
jgi:hypothetical protein